ncbi:MAG: DNA-processing protein DprA [Sediminibacterium sp.]|jgi:DNA processing protein|nr:DNA-protecting protein DprA [Chitinophagaceae bacterium]MCA6447661.1 DNA-protecting protein DprA [Chitinophagaceae bacterium]
MQKQYWYEIALSLIPETGPILQRRLLDHFGEAALIFKARKKDLQYVEGIGALLAKRIKEWDEFSLVDEELRFTEQHHIQIYCVNDKAYPLKLAACPDAPLLIYEKGHTPLNNTKMLSIIGTRNNTIYGKKVTEQLIAALPKDITIVSGLAFGIDAIAHSAAMDHQLPTIGVLAHGLNEMYPAQHKQLAREMIQQGALLTEFGKGVKADKHNFPRRNRIVAGLSDATIVIETAHKGGSMITADMAFHYNREVFAVPGRIQDEKSSGCLQLIEQNKATVYTSVNNLLETLKWTATKKKKTIQQLTINTLSRAANSILDTLKTKETIYIDELKTIAALSDADLSEGLLVLELEQLISILPGKKITLL